jgi:hypothetical protein
MKLSGLVIFAVLFFACGLVAHDGWLYRRAVRRERRRFRAERLRQIVDSAILDGSRLNSCLY